VGRVEPIPRLPRRRGAIHATNARLARGRAVGSCPAKSGARPGVSCESTGGEFRLRRLPPRDGAMDCHGSPKSAAFSHLAAL